MSEPEHFPDVSNWQKEDPENDGDVLDVWVNETTGLKMRLRSLDGPFGAFTSKYVVEARRFPSDDPEWEQLGEAQQTQSQANRIAYDHAVNNNE